MKTLTWNKKICHCLQSTGQMYSGSTSVTVIKAVLRCAQICKHSYQAKNMWHRDKAKQNIVMQLCAFHPTVGPKNVALLSFLKIQNIEKPWFSSVIKAISDNKLGLKFPRVWRHPKQSSGILSWNAACKRVCNNQEHSWGWNASFLSENLVLISDSQIFQLLNKLKFCTISYSPEDMQSSC